MRDLGVARPELRLVIFVAVPIEPEPAHPVEDRVDRLLGRAGLVGVLDPQQELAAVVAGKQPVEQARCGRRRCAGIRSARARSGSRPALRCQISRLRSSALSSSLHAAMQWTSAPNIGEAPLPQRARGYWKARFSALPRGWRRSSRRSARSFRRGSWSASGAGSPPGSRSTAASMGWPSWPRRGPGDRRLLLGSGRAAGRSAGSRLPRRSAARWSGPAPTGSPQPRLERPVVPSSARTVETRRPSAPRGTVRLTAVATDDRAAAARPGVDR